MWKFFHAFVFTAIFQLFYYLLSNLASSCTRCLISWKMGAGVKACMETKHHVDEEPYEVSLDNYGCRDGPKVGRLGALRNVSSSNEYLVLLQIETQITIGIKQCKFL